jgi:enhanced entry protein EnhC
MKSRMLLLGLSGVFGTSISWALPLPSALDAYREGHYFQASAKLKQAAGRDAVADYYLSRLYLYGYGELKNDVLARKYLMQAADRGYLPAMRSAARIALLNDKDATRALYWFQKLADANDVSAQMYCAAAYHVGLGTAVNEDSSRRYLILAAREGNPRAQYALAGHFLNARDAASQRLGVVWLNKALEKEYVPAAVKLSALYKTGRIVQRDIEKANNLLNWVALHTTSRNPVTTADDNTAAPSTPEQAAARWLSDNRTDSLAVCGYQIHGIEHDWRNPQALEQGHYNPAPQWAPVGREALFNPDFVMMPPNQVSLIDYYHGYLQSLVEQPQANLDFPEYPVTLNTVNLQIIQKAVLGDSTVQFQLGQAYQQGIGVDKNIQQAILYYKKAASQLELRAEYNLGLIYLQGLTAKPDYPTAIGWLTHAAFKGNAYAQYALAQILETGYPRTAVAGQPHIAADPDQALSMYYLASANQQPGAQYRLANRLIREQNSSLALVAKEKRDALILSLYSGAAAHGVQEAKLPFAFFQAMDPDKTQQKAAFELAQAQAIAGEPAAALLLGLLYDRGIGVEASHATAMVWYNKAANSSAIDFILGTYLAQGNGIAADLPRAHELLAKATAAGFYYAPLNLAVLEQQQQQPFLQNLLRAHQSGNPNASLLLADYYVINNDPAQVKQARDIYQQLAGQGNPDAQLKLAYLLEYGIGGPQNIAQAASWYENAANQGQILAQYRLGYLQHMGYLSGKPDYEQAKKWYTLAAEHFAPAAVALGFIYETVDDNYALALHAYTLAANQNNALGQFNLGLMYEQGKGVAVDVRRAEQLYLLAANQEHTQAMTQLAGLYLSGALGAPDEGNAIFWFKKAADKNNRDAWYQLGLLSEKGLYQPVSFIEPVIW